MGYYLQALIGRSEAFQSNLLSFGHARVVPISEGLSLVPLTDELYDEMGEGGEVEGFYKLSPGVEALAQRLSGNSPIAYVEAEYFGGLGGQSAAVWKAGKPILGPLRDSDAINQALRLLGVDVGAAAVDEFEFVGLGKHRNTEDWEQNE